MSGPVAVIDIGSNSIKVLVAHRTAPDGIAPLHFRTIDARISTGINQARPRLGEEGMQRGVEAVISLLADTRKFRPVHTALVATSAVRDAENGGEFRNRIRTATGHDVRILTGDEEANLIGRGLTCDPALRELQDFHVFDLGGGSLECLAFRGRQVQRAVSLPLGCVRLTEKLVANPAAPLSPADAEAISAHVRATLVSTFPFELPSTAAAIATGGTITTVRAILGAWENKSFAETLPTITLSQLHAVLAEVGSLPLEQRKAVPGLPPGRADVFPAALVTFIAIAEAGGFAAFRNSLFSLRFGVADELLAGMV